MSTQASPERRTSTRVRTDVPVIAHQNGVAQRLRAVDLSCGGALLQRRSQRQPPMLQRVELLLRGRRTVRGVARTVWARGGLHAVRFVEFSDADRLEIAEHVDLLYRNR